MSQDASDCHQGIGMGVMYSRQRLAEHEYPQHSPLRETDGIAWLALFVGNPAMYKLNQSIATLGRDARRCLCLSRVLSLISYSLRQAGCSNEP